MNERVKNVLQNILNAFETKQIPEAVAFSVFPAPDIPSRKWSFLNRTIMFFSGTMDARGFRQWQSANRFVKKGAKAIYILVPMIYKKEDENGDKAKVIGGFKVSPVFRLEDTDGEPLDYEKHELPELPLMERAREWGLNVKAIPGNYRFYGYYSPDRKEIALATKEECVFFHELSHAADNRIKGHLKKGQDPFQEIIADLSAQALCSLAGKTGTKHLGNTYQYIKKYAEELDLQPVSACLKVLSEVEQVLNLILKGGENV